jgi:cytochrome c551/c552
MVLGILESKRSIINCNKDRIKMLRNLAALTLIIISNLSLANEGEALAKQKACLGCHTVQYSGISYPPALTKVSEKYKNDSEHIKNVIRNGKGKMPAHPTLTDAEINLLTKYVLDLTN